METTSKLSILAVTLITFGSLTGGAKATIIMTWDESGGNVTTTLSGSTIIEGIEASNTGVFREAAPDFFYDLFGPNFEFVNSGTSQVSFAADFTASMSGNFDQVFGVNPDSIIFPETLSLGDTFAPTGSITFIGQSFNSLFGTADVADYISFSWSSGNPGVVSQTIPEPSSTLMLCLGALGIASRRRRLN